MYGYMLECELRQQPGDNKCAAEEEDSHDHEHKNAISETCQSRPHSEKLCLQADGRNGETPERKDETDRHCLRDCGAVTGSRCDLS